MSRINSADFSGTDAGNIDIIIDDDKGEHIFSPANEDASLFLDIFVETKRNLLENIRSKFEENPFNDNGLEKGYHTDGFYVHEYYSESGNSKPISIHFGIQNTKNGNSLGAVFEADNKHKTYSLKDFHLYAKDEDPAYPFPDAADAARKTIKYLGIPKKGGNCGSDCTACSCCG